MNAFDVLSERGFVFQVSDADALRAALASPLTCYTGFDPTAASLHIGHFSRIMQLAHLQHAGHRPIVLCGGGTAMVGDPSGKTSTRPILSREAIDANIDSQQRQLTRILDFSADSPCGAIVVNNADWLCKLNYVDFLREIGRHFSVNQMLSAEIYKTRLGAEENLSFLEFNYQLLQAYDFLHLYREYGCTLQCAGSDQWANCLAGMDLIRKLAGAAAHVLCSPLLTTSSGAKMGKTERGAVWLDPDLTPPYELFQYLVNCDDPDVAMLLRQLTFVPMDEIRELCAVEGAELREAKRRLAWEVTALVHSEPAADEAAAAAQALFGSGAGDRGAMPSTALPAADLAGLAVIDAFVMSGLCKSKGEARRLLTQGGVYVNDTRIDDLEATLDDGAVEDGEILLRAGKKRYHRLVVS